MPMHDSPRDQVLHAMTREGWASESDGDTESPTGYFSRISNNMADIVSIIDAFAGDAFEIAPDFDFSELVGHFLLVENDQGQIFVTAYNSEKELRNAYMDLVVAYCDYRGMPAWRVDGDDED